MKLTLVTLSTVLSQQRAKMKLEGQERGVDQEIGKILAVGEVNQFTMPVTTSTTWWLSATLSTLRVRGSRPANSRIKTTRLSSSSRKEAKRAARNQENLTAADGDQKCTTLIRNLTYFKNKTFIYLFHQNKFSAHLLMFLAHLFNYYNSKQIL